MEDLRVQFLAGLITETQYRESKEKPSETLNERVSRITNNILKEMNLDVELEEAKKDEEEVEDFEISDEETDSEEMDSEGDEFMDSEPTEENDDELMNSLNTALDLAKETQDEKLITQIENTITFLTRSNFQK
jgi:hypothetical protein